MKNKPEMTALLHLAWQIDRFHCKCVMRFLSTAQISTPSIKNFHPIILVKFKQLLHLHSLMSAKRCVPSTTCDEHYILPCDYFYICDFCAIQGSFSSCASDDFWN